MNFKITLNLWALITIVLVVVLLHIVVCKPHTQTVTVTVVDTVQNYVYKDTSIYADTVYMPSETLYIDHTTPLGDIPIRTLGQSFTRTLRHGKQVFTISHLIETDYRGIIYGMRQTPYNDTFELELKSPKSVHFFLQGLITIDTQKDYSLETGGGVQFGKHLFIYGGAEVDQNLQAEGKISVGYRL